MFTVVAMVHGPPGLNVLQPVMVVPNIDQDHMIADNLMILKPFYAVLLASTRPGLTGHHAPSAMASKTNSFWLQELVSKAVLVNQKSKKRLAALHVVHTGEF